MHIFDYLDKIKQVLTSGVLDSELAKSAEMGINNIKSALTALTSGGTINLDDVASAINTAFSGLEPALAAQALGNHTALIDTIHDILYPAYRTISDASLNHPSDASLYSTANLFGSVLFLLNKIKLDIHSEDFIKSASKIKQGLDALQNFKDTLQKTIDHIGTSKQVVEYITVGLGILARFLAVAALI